MQRYEDFLAEKAPWLNYLTKKEFWDDLAEVREADGSVGYMRSIATDIERKLGELQEKVDASPEDWMGLDYLVSDIHAVASSKEIFDKHIYSGVKEQYGFLHDSFFQHFKGEMLESQAEEKCDEYFHRIWRADIRQRNYFHRAQDPASAERYREFLLQKYDVDERGELVPLKWDRSGDVVRAFRPGSKDLLFEQTKEKFEENTYDFIFAGGVGGLINSVMLAKNGYKVAVFDEGKIGEISKRWTIAYDEAYHFVELGILTNEELESCFSEYRSFSNVLQNPKSAKREPINKIRFKGAVSLDSPKLLGLLKSKLEKVNEDRKAESLPTTVTLMDNTSFDCLYDAGENAGNVVKVKGKGGDQFIYAKSCFTDSTGMNSSLMAALNPDFAIDYSMPVTAIQASGFERGNASDQIADTRNYELLATISNAEGIDTPHGHTRETWQPLLSVNPDESDSLIEYYYAVSSVKQDSPQNFFELFSNLYEINKDERYKKKGEDFKILEPAIFGSIPSTTARNRNENIRPRKGVAWMGDAVGNVNPLTFSGFNNFVRNMLPRYAAMRHMADSGNIGKDVAGGLVENNTVDLYTTVTELLVELTRKKEGDPQFLNRVFRHFLSALDTDKNFTDVNALVYKQIIRDRVTPIDCMLGVYAIMKSQNRLDIFQGLTKAFLSKFKTKTDSAKGIADAVGTLKNYFTDQIRASLEADPQDARKGLLTALRNVSESPEEQFKKISNALDGIDLDSPAAIKKLYYTIAKNWSPGQERTPGAKKKDWSYVGVAMNLMARELGMKKHKK